MFISWPYEIELISNFFSGIRTLDFCLNLKRKIQSETKRENVKLNEYEGSASN